MQIWAESGKSALPICNYSQILYQFLTFTQNLKRSHFFTLLLLLYRTIISYEFPKSMFTFYPIFLILPTSIFHTIMRSQSTTSSPSFKHKSTL